MTVPPSRSEGEAGHVADHNLIRGELQAAELVEAEVIAARGGQASVDARLDLIDTAVAGKADAATLAESVRDTMGTALVAGSNVTITVSDPGDTITIAATGGGGGATDHGALTGLADDDHTQYALADGSRGSFAATGHNHAGVYDAAGTAAALVDDLSGVSNAATARTNLGLGGAAVLSVGTTAGTVAAGDDSRVTGAAQKASNLSDLADAATARTNLGLGDAATKNTGTAAGTVSAGDHSHAGGSGHTIKDEGSSLTARANIDFTGGGVTASDVVASDATRVYVPGPFPLDPAKATNWWTWPIGAGSSQNFGTYQRCYFLQYVVPVAARFDQFRVQVDTGAASGVVRMGVYGDVAGAPDALIADWGTVSATTAGTKTSSTFGTAWTPAAGTYWLAVCIQGASAVKLRGYTPSWPSQSRSDAAAYTVPCAIFFDDGISGALGAGYGFGGNVTDGIAPFVQIRGRAN